MSNTPVAKVAVYKDGRVTLDAKPVTIDDLREVFARMRESGGTVLYYREVPQGDPPPVAMDVMRAVVEARLPIRFSTQPPLCQCA